MDRVIPFSHSTKFFCWVYPIRLFSMLNLAKAFVCFRTCLVLEKACLAKSADQLTG